MLLTLWHEYVLKAIVEGAYSSHTVCIVTAMWSSWSVSPSDISFPVYASRINVYNALRGSDSSKHKHVGTCRIHEHKTLHVHHSAPNVKLCQIFAVKMGDPPLSYFHIKSLVKIAFYVLWHIWGEMLLDFHHENKAKCNWIFAMETWQRSQTHLGSIDRDHTLSESKPQSPIHLKSKFYCQ